LPFLLISLLSLLIFVLLFTFRSADDNRLTSWQWVFNGVSPATVFVVLSVGISLALLFLKVSFSPRFPSLVLFLTSFVIAAFFWRAPEVIVDASRYFTQAKHLELYGIGYFFKEWGNAIQCWTDLPLMPFLYGVIFRIFAESRLYVQVFTTILFSMTVVLTYLIGKKLWDEETGLLGGALFLGMPYLFTQVPLMLVDVPTMFFLTLAVFTFMKGIERGRWVMAYASVSLFLAIFSKYSTWPMLSVLVVTGVVYLKKALPVASHPPVPPLPREGIGAGAEQEGDLNVMDRRVVLLRGIMIIALALVMAGVVVLLKYDVFSEQIRLLLQFQKPGLRKWGESFLSTFFFQIHPFITVSAVYSFYAAFKKRDIRYAVICWLVILLVVFQVRRIRYTLPVFPMVALMASYGLRQIRDKDLRRFIVLCALLSSLTVSVLAYRPFLEKISTVNLVKAGEFLNGLEGKTVQVYTLPQEDAVLNPAVAVPLLDLFTKKKILYQYDPGFFPHREEAATSPLRFTWEYANPRYYGVGNEYSERNIPVVVLSGRPVETFPEDMQDRLKGYRLLREFDTYEGVYSFRTVVTVYTAQSPAPSQSEGR